MGQAAELFPVYWSKQHGAYITLLVGWIIAVLLSPHFVWEQIPVFILLLAGLHFAELLVEKFKRKSPLPFRKYFWLFAYGIITLSSSILVWNTVPVSRILLPFLVIGFLLFFFLSLQGLNKSYWAEWISFSVFSLAALLAYRPSDLFLPAQLFQLWFLMSVYFGASIFTVKIRLNKLPQKAGIGYVLAVIILMFLMDNTSSVSQVVAALLCVKLFQVVIWKSWYSRLKIARVGMLESFYHLVFIVILFLLYN